MSIVEQLEDLAARVNAVRMSPDVIAGEILLIAKAAAEAVQAAPGSPRTAEPESEQPGGQAATTNARRGRPTRSAASRQRKSGRKK